MTLFDTLATATNPATTAATLADATSAAKDPATAPAPFYNFEEIRQELKKIDSCTWEEFKAMEARVIAHKTNILQILNKFTIPDLKKQFTFYGADTKQRMIEKVYDSVISSFVLGGGVSYMMGYETYESALTKKLNNQTGADLQKYQDDRRKKKEAHTKAVTNPETLEEFRIFIQFKGSAALTSEQKARYDELFTDTKRDQRSREDNRKAEVKAVEVSEGLEMEIKKSYHAKKKIDLWVVVLSSRVDGEQFAELKDRAQKLGGYYSSYRGQGAIPGFTFENEKGADLFTQVKAGNVDATELREQTEAERLQDRAEILEDKAGNIEDRATDSLNTERKDNTHRRAQMAASAERQAMAQLEFSQTMAQIAARMKAGSIKYLDRLQNITELETLMQILTAAKWKHIYAKDLRTEINGYEFTTETAEYVKFPYPEIWKDRIGQDLNKVQYETGKVMAARRIQKRLDNLKADQNILVCTGTGIEDFETVFCGYSKKLDKYSRESYSRDLMRYKRVMRLRLESLPELRAAIRELIDIINGVEVSPEVKKMQQLRDLERKFIGRDIPGFFPTPAMLAAEVVDTAGIQEGDKVCEPQAGLGHIAQVIREQHPGADLTCVEYNSSLADALQQKGFSTINGDFLQHTGNYDKIVMNPPFENGQDIDHVLHAWSLLNAGGRIVAIMSGNKWKKDEKTQKFAQFLDENGGTMEANPDGAFLSSFRPTGVNTVTVILDKPGTKEQQPAPAQEPTPEEAKPEKIFYAFHFYEPGNTQRGEYQRSTYLKLDSSEQAREYADANSMNSDIEYMTISEEEFNEARQLA